MQSCVKSGSTIIKFNSQGTGQGRSKLVELVGLSKVQPVLSQTYDYRLLSVDTIIFQAFQQVPLVM